MTKTDIELEMANNLDRALIGVAALHNEIARLRALLLSAARALRAVTEQPGDWANDTAQAALAAIPEGDR